MYSQFFEDVLPLWQQRMQAHSHWQAQNSAQALTLWIDSQAMRAAAAQVARFSPEALRHGMLNEEAFWSYHAWAR